MAETNLPETMGAVLTRAVCFDHTSIRCSWASRDLSRVRRCRIPFDRERAQQFPQARYCSTKKSDYDRCLHCHIKNCKIARCYVQTK